MPRNYDTTSGLPYVKVVQLSINDIEGIRAKPNYTERVAIVDASGQPRVLDEAAATHPIDLDKLDWPVPRRNPVTGAVIPGQFVTREGLMLDNFSVVRAAQLARDADDAAGQPQSTEP